MRMLVFMTAASIGLASANGGAQTALERRGAAAPNTIKARFTCTEGKWIEATFVNGPSGSVRLTLSDKRHVTLPQAMSASGARYANKDETFVFWNKGNTAFIEEKGKTTYDGCTNG